MIEINATFHVDGKELQVSVCKPQSQDRFEDAKFNDGHNCEIQTVVYNETRGMLYVTIGIIPDDESGLTAAEKRLESTFQPVPESALKWTGDRWKLK